MAQRGSVLRPMTATAAAAWLKVSEETLRAWATAGELSYVDLRVRPDGEPGPGLHFHLEALEDFVRRRTRRIVARGKVTKEPATY